MDDRERLMRPFKGYVEAMTMDGQIRGSLIHNKPMPLWERLLYPVLWKLHLGWTYNRLKCKLGVYTHFADGRCQWCGEKH